MNAPRIGLLMRYLAIALVIVLVLVAGPPGETRVYLVDFQEPGAEHLTMEAINALRYREGLPLLAIDEALSRVCRRHALDMTRRDYFDHYTPEGLSPDDRAHAAGLPYEISENIGIIRTFGQDLPEVVDALMRGFLESSDHRANLLDPNLTHVGIGFYQDMDGGNHSLGDVGNPDSVYRGYGTVLVVQDFCRKSVTFLEPSPFRGQAEPGKFLTLRLDFMDDVDEAFLRIIPPEGRNVSYEVPLRKVEDGFRARFAIGTEGAFTLAIYASSPSESWFYREQGRVELRVKSR